MNRVWLLLSVLLLQTAAAQDADDLIANGNLRVRAYLEPEGEIYIGQQLQLYIEIATDTWLTQPPRYPELDLAGVIALQPAQAGGNFSERAGGKTYAGVRHRYLLYPQRAGEFVIPPFTLTMAVATDAQPVEVTTSTAVLRFSARMPAAAADLSQFVTSSRLTVTETYEPAPEGLKVGDAITRTVTIKADNALALLLPEVRFTPVDGLQVYPAQARLTDSTERGRYRGQRVNAVTYVLEQAGDIELPAIELYWWQPDEQILHTETLPAVRFNVAQALPDESLNGLESGQPSGETWLSILGRWARAVLDWLLAHLAGLTLLAIALYLLVLAVRKYQVAVLTWWQAYRQREQASEQHYFREFCWACWGADESQIMASFWRWLDRLPARFKVSNARELAVAADAPKFAAHSRAAEVSRYTPKTSMQANQAIAGDTLLLQVAQVRRQLFARSKRKATVDSSLNPGVKPEL